MTDPTPAHFENVTSVIRDPLHFKYKLDIGDDAYRSLRLKKHLLDAVDAGNGAVMGFGLAKSSLVASTFFAPSGFLGAIGIGTAATPVGWAIAAGVVGAGLSLVVGKHLIRGKSKQSRTVPDYINTPMDILAVGLFDLIGLLGVKLALVDGRMDQRERDRIKHYFVAEWGYDEKFVNAGIAELEGAAANHELEAIAEQLATFKKENPDCNYSSMATEILTFLRELSEADGTTDEREEAAIAEVQAIFEEVSRLSLTRMVASTVDTVTDVGKRGADTLGTVVNKVSEAKDKILKKASRQNDEAD